MRQLFSCLLLAVAALGACSTSTSAQPSGSPDDRSAPLTADRDRPHHPEAKVHGVRGTDDDDVLAGGSGPDVIDGRRGSDIIRGRAGNDELRDYTGVGTGRGLTQPVMSSMAARGTT